MTSSVKKIANGWIDENRERLIAFSDAIWEYAERGFVEYKSAKLLADELESHGFGLERGVAGIPTAARATTSTTECVELWRELPS